MVRTKKIFKDMPKAPEGPRLSRCLPDLHIALESPNDTLRYLRQSLNDFLEWLKNQSPRDIGVSMLIITIILAIGASSFYYDEMVQPINNLIQTTIEMVQVKLSEIADSTKELISTVTEQIIDMSIGLIRRST